MTADEQPRPTCAATTAAGRPCRARPRPDTDVCAFHDPALAEVRADARARGGANRSAVVRLTSRMPTTVAALVEDVLASLADVRAGRMAPARGQAVASLARAALAAYQAEEVERRLDAIEDHLDAVGATSAAVARWPR